MFNRKYIFNPGPFSMAMLDYRSVDNALVSGKCRPTFPPQPQRDSATGRDGLSCHSPGTPTENSPWKPGPDLWSSRAGKDI